MDLKDMFAQAAAVVAGLPKNLQEAAFHRALDHLLGRGPQGVAAGAPPSATRGPRQIRSPDTSDLAERIDRTRHPDVGSTTRLADRALKVLALAHDDYGTDGLTAAEIAKILTTTFRLPAKANSVSMALTRERKTAHLRKNGGRAVFHITEPGEKYLASLAADAATSTTPKPQRRKGKRNDRKQERPAAPPKAGLKKGQAPAKAPQTASNRRRRSSKSERLGPKAAIEQLINSGFFKTARAISQVRDELKNRLGSEYTLQELSISLVRLLRSSALKRERNSSHQYEYRA